MQDRVAEIMDAGHQKRKKEKKKKNFEKWG